MSANELSVDFADIAALAEVEDVVANPLGTFDGGAAGFRGGTAPGGFERRVFLFVAGGLVEEDIIFVKQHDSV